MAEPASSESNATAPDSSVPVALLLLAAGASARMGQPKQLLPYRGRSLLRHAAETAVASGCAPLVLITGALHEELLPEITGLPIQAVRNPAWETGMASSLQAGLAAVAGANPAAVLIMLTDQPLVTPELLRQLVVQQQRTQAPAVAAAYADALGVPAIFSARLVPELLKLQGAQGANRLLTKLGEAVGRVDFPDGLLDVDTPAQYAALVAAG